jgi:peptidoglycan/xylan/chitin deacetylase (PgdA/CDA1 family)
MHDGGGPRSATVAAVPAVIKKLRAKGYDFVTLDEMAALGYAVR